ncbi:MAG: hypothetical protein VW338_04730 [Rhodospirillaceae bacterium]
MPAGFYFAWCDEGEPFSESAHAVDDLGVIAFEILHNEGDFAALTVEVKNPGTGLLAAGRQQWLWAASIEESPGVVPIFHGRLVAVPEDSQDEVVRLTFTAKPATWSADRAALAETLKVAPYWDAVFVEESKRTGADAVLDARPAHWHVDRVSHAVTISDILAGEAGVIDLGGDYFLDSLRIGFGQVPGRRARVEASVYWDQRGQGEVNLTAALYKASRAAGGPAYGVSTYTGAGLASDWPEKGQSIGSGWSVAANTLRRGDGVWLPVEVTTIIMTNGTTAHFPKWRFGADFRVAYDVTRSKSEKLVFTLEADVQALRAEPGEDEVIEITVASSDVAAAIDPADTANPDGALPIGDPSARAYFTTERGRDSLAYLIALARAELLRRARAVEITFETTWENGLDLSCRHSVRIVDPRLPGGEATGKVVGYALTADGDSGIIKTRVKLGCSIGRGGSVVAVPGTPSYVEEGYVEAGYQFYDGATVLLPSAGDVTYEDYADQLPADDGVDFGQMTADTIVEQFIMINGESAQRSVLEAFPIDDIASAMAALDQVYSEFLLELTPLAGGPFATDYAITVSDLVIPKTIDLEAA